MKVSPWRGVHEHLDWLEKKLVKEIRRSRRIEMAAIDDAVTTLVAEDGVVITALNDLKNNPDPNVQAAAQKILDEVARVDAVVQQTDPGAEPTPAPAPGPTPGA